MKNNRLWFIGTALVTVAVILLGLVLGILPKLAEVTVADLDTATVLADNDARRAEVARYKEQYENIDDIQDSLDDLQVALPPTPGYTDIIRELNELTAAAGVSFYAVTTSKVAAAVQSINAPSVAPADAAAGVDTGPAQLTPAEQGGIIGSFNAVPMTVTVRGSYAAVTHFIDLLQHNDRIFLVLNINYKIPEAIGGYEVAISGAMFTFSQTAGYPDTLAGEDFPAAPVVVEPSPTNTPTSTPTNTPAP